MRRAVRLSRLAQADIDDILVYLTPRNLRAAQRFVNDFHRRLALLSDRPFASRPRDEVAEGLRSVVLRPYIIYFRILQEHVLILRVIHGARDVSDLRESL